MDELNITSEGLLDAVGDMLAESGLVSDASAVKMDDTVATMTVVIDGKTFLVTVRQQ